MNTTDRDDDHQDAHIGKTGGAMPMPHGSDTAAPLPPEDGALPMPHGTDPEVPEWSGTQRDNQDDTDDDA